MRDRIFPIRRTRDMVPQMERVVRNTLRTLLIFAALASVSTLSCEGWYISSSGKATPAFLRKPIQTSTTVRQNGHLVSKRITYSIGDYGICEFGNVRLAVKGKPFSGRSSGTLLLSTNSNAFSKNSGRTGVGNRRFEHTAIPGGSSCKFAGLSFDIVNGKLKLLDASVSVNGKPTLIVVNAGGKIDALVELPLNAPGMGLTRDGDVAEGRDTSTSDNDKTDDDDPTSADQDPFGNDPFGTRSNKNK